MREWFLKWQKVIIWVVAVFFIAGMVWWSVDSYVSMNLPTSQGTNTASQTPGRSEALVVLTKDGTDLSYDYWVFPQEMSDSLQQIVAYYKQMGQDIDELFQQPYVELDAAYSLIDGKILSYYAAKTNISPTKEAVEAEIDKIVAENITTDEIRTSVIARYGSVDGYKNLIREPVRNQLTRDKVSALVSAATETQFKEYYDKNLETLKEKGNQVKAAHILLNTEEEAQNILTKLRSGELNFTQAASDFSLDPSGQATGGQLEWFGKNAMVKEFEDAAFAGTAGELVGPVKTEFGYHIIRIDEKKTLQSYEDFMNQSALVEEAKTTIGDENFTKWLEQYKNSQNFTYEINDNVLQILDQYGRETKEGVDKVAVVAFRKNLEPYILTQKEGKTVWATDTVDPRISALFLTVLETQQQEIQTEITLYDRYSLLKSGLNPSLANLNLTQIQDRIKGLDVSLENVLEGATRTLLLNDKFALKDAEEYLQKEEEIRAKNVKLEEIQKTLESVRALQTQNEDLILLGYRVLYDTNTSSQAVIEKLYQLDQNNSEVALRYFQNNLQLLLPYLQNKSIYTQYQYYLDPQFNQIQASLLGIARDPETSEGLRISAYENVLTLLESWGRYEEEQVYLQELKTLKPDYPDIDLIIQQVKDTLMEAERIATEEASATVSAQASATIASTSTSAQQ